MKIREIRRALRAKRQAWLEYEDIRHQYLELIVANAQSINPLVDELRDQLRDAYREYESASAKPWDLTGGHLFGKYRTAAA